VVEPSTRRRGNAGRSQLEAVKVRGQPTHFRIWLDFVSRNSYNQGMKSTVSEKGQVTIPRPLRKKLGLAPGQILEFETRDGMLIARKAPMSVDPVEKVTGILPPMDVDKEIARMRGPAWNPRNDEPRAKRR
jgi:AbrB family looped-hinge helix DNA binding protein